MFILRAPASFLAPTSVLLPSHSPDSSPRTTAEQDVLHCECSNYHSALLSLIQQQKELSHTIHLHPSYFGPRMLQFLESKLYSDVEGTCSGEFGYIIAVVSILDIGKGMVMPGSGQAEFVTRYRAIVFKPFKGQVVDGVVNNVNKVRLPRRSMYACLWLWGWLRGPVVRWTDGFLRGRRTFDCIRVAPGEWFALAHETSAAYNVVIGGAH